MSKHLDRIWKGFQGFLTQAHEFILTKESSPLSGGFSSVLTCSYTWSDFCIRNELVLKVNKLTFFYQVKKNDIVLLPFKLRKAEKQIKNSADVKRLPQILEHMHFPAIFFSFICPVSYLFWIFSSCLGILLGKSVVCMQIYVVYTGIRWLVLLSGEIWRMGRLSTGTHAGAKDIPEEFGQSIL